MTNHRESADTEDTERSIYEKKKTGEYQLIRISVFGNICDKTALYNRTFVKIYFKRFDPHLDLYLLQTKTRMQIQGTYLAIL
jgi:hypothetical protein